MRVVYWRIELINSVFVLLILLVSKLEIRWLIMFVLVMIVIIFVFGVML